MKQWLSRVPHLARVWTLFAYWTLMYLMTHLPGIDKWKPPGGWWVDDPDDFVHYLAYTGWLLVWAWVLAGAGRQINAIAAFWLVLGGALYGGFDELTQGIVGRTPDWHDWFLDISGLLTALLIVIIYQRKFGQSADAPRA